MYRFDIYLYNKCLICNYMATKPRFLVSLDDEDIREIDALVSAKHYDSRSQFARLAIRTYLANKKHMLMER